MVVPIIMILLCAVLGAGAYIYVKKADSKKSLQVDGQLKTANEFVNVKDIKDKFLYTKDNMILCFLKIYPISIDLFSKSEKNLIIKKLTADISGIQHPFKFIAVSRPVDISPLITELSELLTTSDLKQKELLKQEILEMSTFALSGEVVERQFYIILWEKDDEGAQRDLIVRAKDLSNNFIDNGIGCDILEQQDIVRLCNLINNPAYMHLEDSNFESNIPIIKGGVSL